MGYSIQIPDGFHSKSYIRWMATAEVDNGLGAPDATFHRQVPPLTNKVREVVQPHSNGGIVRLNITMNYKLFKSVEAMGLQIPHEVESDMFTFGCEWPYSYSKDQLAFGPTQKFTDRPRGFKLLQGSCEDVQDKDQAGTVRPYAYAVPQLSLKSAPGDPPSGWTLQLPFVGGPAYTPQGGAPTPDGGFRLGSFWIELQVVVPAPFTRLIQIKLKPLYFIQSFYAENDDDITKNEDLVALRNWVSAVKASDLYPVIKDGSLPIHIEGHASKTGDDLLDFDLSQRRRQKMQKRFEGMIETNARIVFNDRGKWDASQVDLPPNQRNEGYLKDRYVKIEIREDEAESALALYYQKGGR